jgi:hypothetical protein
MIIQGTNRPIVLKFDQDVSGLSDLIVTIWDRKGTLIKEYKTADLTIVGDTVSCPLTEAESAALPLYSVTLEAKGLDDGETVFWDKLTVNVVRRNDKSISLEA